MSDRQTAVNEIEQTPDDLLPEVIDYIRFLKAKQARERLEITVVSESSLKKDWDRPEEDDAWRSL
jgi:hypothetical protein